MNASTPSTPRKFAFDLEFAEDGHVVRRAETMRTRFSREELDAARREGEDAGRRSEEARAAQSARAACEEILRKLSPAPRLLNAEAEHLRREASELALAIGKALGGLAIAQFGETQILAAVEECLSHLRGEPRVVLRVSPAFAGAAEQYLVPLANDMGWAERIMVRPDPQAAPGDWLVEWGSGSMGFSQIEALARIEAALAAHLVVPAELVPESGSPTSSHPGGAQ